jgi:hypothetical protein
MKGDVWLSYGGDRYTELDRMGGDANRGPDVLLRAADGAERWWTAKEREEAWIDPKCIDCDVEQGTSPGGRCRDCDIEYVMSSGACRECHTWLINPEFAEKTIADQHAKGCSLRAVEDCYARDDAEIATIRRARYGYADEAALTPASTPAP